MGTLPLADIDLYWERRGAYDGIEPRSNSEAIVGRILGARLRC